MLWMVVLCVLVTVVVSFFTRKPTPDQIKGLTFATLSKEEQQATRASWNRWDVVHSAIIVGLVALMYVYFW